MPTSIDYELQKTAKEVQEALAIVFQKGTCKPDRFHNLRFMDGDELLKDNPYLRDILPHLPISEDPDYVYDVLPDTLDCGPMVGDYLITPTFVITKNYSFKTPIIYKDKLNMESYMDISPSEIATQQSHI
jgi:hypothetical protein